MSTMQSTLQTANIEGIVPCCCSHGHEISLTSAWPDKLGVDPMVVDSIINERRRGKREDS